MVLARKLVPEQAVGIADVPARVSIRDVHVHVPGEQPVFIANHSWTAFERYVRQFAQWHLLVSSNGTTVSQDVNLTGDLLLTVTVG